jgi:hypothetical protein
MRYRFNESFSSFMDILDIDTVDPASSLQASSGSNDNAEG